ncbi:heavy-metal-associated domain-containing protein [soil metagenome]
MTCGGCVSNVTSALSAVPGVNNVDVSLPKHTATVKFDEDKTSIDAMRTAVRSAGYDIVETPVKTTGGCRCGSKS